MTHETLSDLLARRILADPLDAEPVFLEADVMADDMARYTPTAVEPRRLRSPAFFASRPPGLTTATTDVIEP